MIQTEDCDASDMPDAAELDALWQSYVEEYPWPLNHRETAFAGQTPGRGRGRQGRQTRADEPGVRARQAPAAGLVPAIMDGSVDAQQAAGPEESDELHFDNGGKDAGIV